MYYGSSDGLHTSWRNGFFCLATLRPDGFAGYKASDVAEPATVTTAPVFDGKAPLRVSADIANGGKLVVRVLGEEKQVLAESEPLATTVSDADVRWLDDNALDGIGTKRARLQFAFQEATVYSFSLKALGSKALGSRKRWGRSKVPEWVTPALYSDPLSSTPSVTPSDLGNEKLLRNDQMTL